MQSADTVQMLGAGLFGAVLGWQLYAIGRYRTGSRSLKDLGAIVGGIGGAAILNLFPAQSDLFGAYGIGLAVGFFAYFVALLVMVSRSDKFGVEWFLDGRRTRATGKEVIPPGTATTVAPMVDKPDGVVG
jgi:hypothetical protein